jgi:hypothetical protein
MVIMVRRARLIRALGGSHLGIAMKIIWLIIAIISLTQVATAQNKSPLRFKDYPAKVFKGKPAPAKISGSRARLFRTVIREGAKEGPNFAGHYTIVIWSVGLNLMQLAIVDALNGKVYFPSQLLQIVVPFNLSELDTEYSLDFQLNSRLLIVAGGRMGVGDDEEYGKFYYEWRNNQLRLIHAIKKK